MIQEQAGKIETRPEVVKRLDTFSFQPISELEFFFTSTEHKSEKKPEVKAEPMVTSEEFKVKEEPPATPVKETTPTPTPTVFSETVKQEVVSPVKSPVHMDDDDSEDDMPLMNRAPSKPVKMEESDSEDDTPLVGVDYVLYVCVFLRVCSH